MCPISRFGIDHLCDIFLIMSAPGESTSNVNEAFWTLFDGLGVFSKAAGWSNDSLLEVTGLITNIEPPADARARYVVVDEKTGAILAETFRGIAAGDAPKWARAFTGSVGEPSSSDDALTEAHLNLRPSEPSIRGYIDRDDNGTLRVLYFDVLPPEISPET